MIGPYAVHMASGPGSPYGGMPGGWGQPPGGGPGAPPPGGGGFGPGGGGGMSSMGPGPRNDALGVVSLITGILGLILACANIITMIFGACCVICTVGSTFIGAIAAVLAGAGLVTGILSVRRINQSPDELTGKGMAIAGAVISGIGLLIAIATIVLPWLGIGCLAASNAAGGSYGGGNYGGGSYGGGASGGGASGGGAPGGGAAGGGAVGGGAPGSGAAGGGAVGGGAAGPGATP